MRHLVPLLFLLSYTAFSQNTAIVFGQVTDITNGQAVDLANVYIKGTNNVVSTDEAGRYALQVPAGQRLTLGFRRVGFQESSHDLVGLPAGSRFALDAGLAPVKANIEAVIRERRLDDQGLVKEKNMAALKLLPTTTGNLESVLPHLALGTNAGTGGELSSQYQVRGGNYDENLVYVNDFEIYRPQLIRAGQQEGLTFANIDLVRDLSFSSGGFQAKYGDKLSSVLDIKYKRPDSLRASAAGSFLGGSAHVEGSFKPKKDGFRAFRYLFGARYKTNKPLLSQSLDLKGEYQPDFSDIQTYLTYDLSRDWQIGFLGNYNRSNFLFYPISGEKSFGLVDFALRLSTAFEGQEQDDFTNGLAGVSLTWLPSRERNPLYHKLLASTWRSQENERIDISGYYILGQVEDNLGSDNFGEIVNVLGLGTQHTWARNYLTADVRNLEYKGGIELQPKNPVAGLTTSHFLQWSVKAQNEAIEDRINEWERLDSALYSLPFDTTQLLVRKVLKTRNTLNSNRLTAFFQDTWTWRKEGEREFQITAGLRAGHWDLNGETFVTPRLQLLYKPLNTAADITWRLAGGLYYQPPFYREMRRLDGVVNRDLLSQKSAHIVGGLTYDFLWGHGRPVKMRLISELYYKKLWDLVPFDVDNVRVRYYGDNRATGYAAGLDLRLNGELVEGAESWINVSLLQTRERFDSIQHRAREIGARDGVPVDFVPRPTDRLLNVGIFFQDYLPKHHNFKVHVGINYGTGLPFGLPEKNVVFRNTYRYPTYHRVDIGFALQLWEQGWAKRHPKHLLRFTRNTWLSLEVFNLLNVANQASKTWIKTYEDTQYAVPNYLTGRRLNLRLRMDF